MILIFRKVCCCHSCYIYTKNHRILIHFTTNLEEPFDESRFGYEYQPVGKLQPFKWVIDLFLLRVLTKRKWSWFSWHMVSILFKKLQSKCIFAFRLAFVLLLGSKECSGEDNSDEEDNIEELEDWASQLKTSNLYIVCICVCLIFLETLSPGYWILITAFLLQNKLVLPW